MIRPETSPALPRRRHAVLVVAVSLLAVLAAWAWSWLAPATAPSLSADRTELIARRISVAFADTGVVWPRVLRAEAGRSYDPVELAFFTRETASACAGAAIVSGSFYCGPTRTAAFDLAFFDDLNARLRVDAPLGAALLVGRIVAEHVQGELGALDAARPGRRVEIDRALDLQTDCLTGVWAAVSAGSLGPVPADFYGELMRISRNVTEDMTRAGAAAPAAPAMFRAGPALHEAAFAAGYGGGGIAACPLPAPGN